MLRDLCSHHIFLVKENLIMYLLPDWLTKMNMLHHHIFFVYLAYFKRYTTDIGSLHIHSCLGGSPSPLYVDVTYSRLAVYTDTGIFGVVIPIDHRVLPCILKLMDFKSDHTTIICLGLRKAIVRNWTSSCLLTYISDGLWDVSG